MRIRTSVQVAMIVGACTVLAPIYGPSIRARAATPQDELDKTFKSVTTVLSLLEQNYADPVSSEKAIYQGAIPGMLRTLDPHSNFLDPTEYQDMQRKQRAQYCGIGMLISMDGTKVIAMEPFPGSPAWKADLRRGDVITGVDLKDVTKKDSAGVAELLRGQCGSPVKVTVMREGAAEPVTVQVNRGGIETSLVDAFWVRPGIVFLKVTSFEAQNVARDVEAALAETGRIQGQGPDPGSARESRRTGDRSRVAGRTLPARWAGGGIAPRPRRKGAGLPRQGAIPLAQKYPIVVLVNGNSASASEIVSGALQDHDRAIIMGENTFGKGLVQAQFPLSEGAALLLTIAHYYTPSGRLIQRDYTKGSFFDYYYSRKPTQNTDDVKSTDIGRKMYGGGGITPDEKYENPKASIFQRRIFNSSVIYRFANTYFGPAKPQLPQGWTPDADLMARFKDYLHSKDFPFTDEDWNRDKKWVSEQIRDEFYLRAFDKKTSDRAQFLDDPEVQKAIENLPKADTLMAEAQKVLARRQ